MATNNAPNPSGRAPVASTRVRASALAAPVWRSVSMFRKVQLLRELKEYMTSRRLTEMEVGELTSFYTRCRVAPEEFSTQYIGLFPEIGLTLQLVDGTAQKIVLVGGAAASGHPMSPPVPPVTEVHDRVTAEHVNGAIPASSPVETRALARSLSKAVSSNAATRIARQRQLVYQLKKYMKSYKLTELRVGALTTFYDAYKVPVGDFSVEYVAMFPEVGLTLRDVPGVGRVIERHDDGTPPSRDAAQIAEQARLARQLLLVRRLKKFMQLRQVTELPLEALGVFCLWCKLPPGEFSPQFVRRFPEVGLTLETDQETGRVVVRMQAKPKTKTAKSMAATAVTHQQSSIAALPMVPPPVLLTDTLQSVTTATASSSPRDDVSLASVSSSSSSSSTLERMSTGSPHQNSVDVARDDAVSMQGIGLFQHENSPSNTVDVPVAEDDAVEPNTASSPDMGRVIVRTSDTLPSAHTARTFSEEDTAAAVIAADSTSVHDDASDAEPDSGATTRSLTDADAVSRTAGPADDDADVERDWGTAADEAADATAVPDDASEAASVVDSVSAASPAEAAPLFTLPRGVLRLQQRRRARQEQLVRQLKEYMTSRGIIELGTKELTSFYYAYEVPKGDFNRVYVDMFPEVGLTYRGSAGQALRKDRRVVMTSCSNSDNNISSNNGGGGGGMLPLQAIDTVGASALASAVPERATGNASAAETPEASLSDTTPSGEQAHLYRQSQLMRLLKWFMKQRRLTEMNVNDLWMFYCSFQVPKGEFHPQLIGRFPELGLSLQPERDGTGHVIVLQEPDSGATARSLTDADVGSRGAGPVEVNADEWAVSAREAASEPPLPPPCFPPLAPLFTRPFTPPLTFTLTPTPTPPLTPPVTPLLTLTPTPADTAPSTIVLPREMLVAQEERRVRQRQLVQQLQEYTVSRRLPLLTPADVRAFMKAYQLSKRDFSPLYVDLFPEVGLTLRDTQDTGRVIVRTCDTLPSARTARTLSEEDTAAAEETDTVTAVASRAEQAQLAVQLPFMRKVRVYMRKRQLTEMSLWRAWENCTRKFPKGEFHPQLIGRFPELGLSLQPERDGAGHVIVLQEPDSGATARSLTDADGGSRGAGPADDDADVERDWDTAADVAADATAILDDTSEAASVVDSVSAASPAEAAPVFTLSRGALRLQQNRRARQEQLVRQLQEYMTSQQITALDEDALAGFYRAYDVPTGDFSPLYVDLFPEVGLTLRDTQDTGRVIVRTGDMSSSSSLSLTATVPTTEQAQLAVQLPLMRLLKSVMKQRRLTEMNVNDLWMLHQRYRKVPKGEFHPQLIGRFPELGLSLQSERGGVGHVIVLQEPDSGATARALTDADGGSRVAGPAEVNADVKRGVNTAADEAAVALAVSDPFQSALDCTPQNSVVESRVLPLEALRAKEVPTATSVAEPDAHDARASPVTLPPPPATSTVLQPFDNASLAPSSSSLETDRFSDESENDVGVVHDHASLCLARYPVGTRLYLSFDAAGHPLVSHEPLAPPAASTPLPPCNTHGEIELLLQMLPPLVNSAERTTLQQMIHLPHATELIYDLGRPPLIRFHSSAFDADADAHDARATANGVGRGSGAVSWTTPISSAAVTRDDIDHVLRAVGGDDRFSSDHRCGLDHTLHRISRRVNRQRTTIGFTMRIGRMIPGSTAMISDLIAARRSILLIGCPGVGKTTLLRDLARVLSASGSNAVEVIDTSNEIAGEGDVPHASIGAARRMMVSDRRRQHETMIEAVQNHMPTCLVIDEIGTKLEARAAMDVRHRGIQLIGTAHGTCLQQLVENPELNGLFGGIHTVILSDGEAARRGLRSKSVQERMGPCAFDCAIELAAVGTWVIHHHLADAVDRLLWKHPQQRPLTYEVRRMRQRTAVEATNEAGPSPRLEMTVEVVSAVEPFHPPPLSTV